MLDFRTLEALGHARHDVHFYEEYLAFCKRLAESNIVKPQSELPAPTPLRTIDRALWEWSRSHAGSCSPISSRSPQSVNRAQSSSAQPQFGGQMLRTSAP